MSTIGADRESLTHQRFWFVRASWLLPALVLFVIPTALNAQFTYTTNNGTITITGYSGTGGAAVIPSTTNGLPVTRINTQAFYNNSTLVSVTIPGSVTNYGDSAFDNCANLVGFYFEGNSPPNYNPAGGLIVIRNCSKATIYYLLGKAGWGSTFDLLPAVHWDPQMLVDLTHTNSGGQVTITGYSGTNNAITMPSTMNGLPVTRIGSNAFLNCTGLTSITLPKSITSIQGWAFRNCSNLAGVYFQGNAPAALSSVFDGATNVTCYYLPNTSGWGPMFASRPTAPVPFSYRNENGRLTISGYSGSGGQVSILSVINGLPVVSIGAQAMQHGNFTSVIIPSSVTSIGDNALRNSLFLTNVTIPHSVTNIGSQAFYTCNSLAMITVDALNSFYTSVEGVLFNKNLTMLIQCPLRKTGSYFITNTVVTIETNAFAYCSSLTNIVIPNGVIKIGNRAFEYCTSATNITIPSSVTDIGSGAFTSCSKLDHATIPNGIRSLSTGVFAYSGLTSVTIPNSVTNIGAQAFYNCNSLTNVTIPNSVIRIGDRAFESCSSLARVTIPNSVSSMGIGVFDGCENLVSMTMPDGLSSIGILTFEGCEGLNTVTIGSAVTNIGWGAFRYCSNLTSVYFKGNAPTLETVVFDGANKAILYYLPGSTGWGATFGGRPTALWQPQVKTSDASFGVRTNRFGFNVNWANDRVIVVEACSNLANPIWSPLQTNTLTGESIYFSDPNWTNHPTRLYRIRSP